MAIKKEISMRGLIDLRECLKTLPFLDLSLGTRIDGRQAFWEALKPFLVGCLAKRMDKDRLRERMEDFFQEHYKESFFDYHIQYETGLQKDKKKLFRMVDYFYHQGYITIAERTGFHVGFHNEYRGIRLEAICDYADLVVQTPEGKYLVIRMETGPPQYSYTGKKESSRVENAIELACLYLGFCDTYGPDVEVALFYFGNKDDRNDMLVDTYEHRRGKNIVQYAFHSKADAWGRLSYDMKMVIPCVCQACWYHEVCRTARYYSCVRPAGQDGEGSGGQREKGRLTPQQEEVVRHKTGQMCVIAVPGAGKTHSLVQRMVRLIQEEHVAPSKILFLTYTQKAAGEIRERVQAYLDEGGSQPSIYTFNALGYSILREHPESLCGGFRLANKVDRYRLIEETLDKAPRIRGISYDGITGEYGLLARLNKAFSFIDNFSREQYLEIYGRKEDTEGILMAYDCFMEAYRANGYISFDDQIRFVNELFISRPDVLRHYQRQYPYIMIDEFQDISNPQVQMVYDIGAHGNIVVVGDDDQSIYGWRGGSSRYMLEFADRWPGAKQVIMEDNFRSVDTILHTAELIISKNHGRFRKKIRAHSCSGRKPVYVNGVTPQGVWNLVQMLLKDGTAPGDIAIIARKNKELAAIEEHLCSHVGVLPSRHFLIDDAVFRTIHDILILYHRGMEDNSFYRYLRLMQADGEIPLQKAKDDTIYGHLCNHGLLLPIDWRDVGCLPEYKKRKEDSRLLCAGYRLIRAFKDIQYAHSLEEMLHILFRQMFNEEHHLVVDALAELASQRRMETSGELLEYMDYMLRYHDETEAEYPRRRDAINLLTAHKAKGKEYPVVIVFNIESYSDTSEDRRLLYVAMTRAKEMLYLTQGPYSKAELVPDFINHVEVHYSQAG